MERNRIKKILLISLSNIGDVVLTTPVIEALKGNFLQACLDILVGPRGKEVLEKNKGVRKLIVYDKHSSLKEKLNLVKSLRRERYDLAVDLRQSIIPYLIRPRYHTPLLKKNSKNLHMCDRHLNRLKALGLPFTVYRLPRIYTDDSDDKYIMDLLRSEEIKQADLLIVIAPGARSSTKRWPVENFIEVTRGLLDIPKTKIILAGGRDDYKIAEEIKQTFADKVINLTGKTSIPQLVVLLKKARLLVTNDSAVLHCGSAANIPTIAIFGPTDPLKYGPLPQNSLVLRRLLHCVPCGDAQCRYRHRMCLKLIKPWEVIEAARKLLQAPGSTLQSKDLSPAPSVPGTGLQVIDSAKVRRVLVVRTDRIGDVVLSTPVIKNLRDNFPQSFIAMMVRPYTKDILRDNPYLDEVIVYDKDKKDKSVPATIKFALGLRKYRFDLAIILHPTNRVHIISYLAKIPKRVGYEKKMGFLNTHKIKETKFKGEKHELEYNLDLLNLLGIQSRDRRLFFPLGKEIEEKVALFLQKQSIGNNELIVIHPGASCPSKLWPAENFAKVSDALIEYHNSRILIVTDKKDAPLGEAVAKHMQQKPILALGEFSLSGLAALLKRAGLFISNDSGPVHIAVAVGTPVVSIFGRNQPGLSPQRWGPLGRNDIVLHKDVGCIACLAHNCNIGFKCLKAITPEDVLEAVEKIRS